MGRPNGDDGIGDTERAGKEPEITGEEPGVPSGGGRGEPEAICSASERPELDELPGCEPVDERDSCELVREVWLVVELLLFRSSNSAPLLLSCDAAELLLDRSRSAEPGPLRCGVVELLLERNCNRDVDEELDRSTSPEGETGRGQMSGEGTGCGGGGGGKNPAGTVNFGTGEPARSGLSDASFV